MDIIITADFTGYPDGKKTGFKEGDTPDLDEDFANLLVTKGLARKTKSKRTDD